KFEVRAWIGDEPVTLFTATIEEAISAFDLKREKAEKESWRSLRRVELLEGKDLMRWADEYEYGHETTLPEEIYNYLINSGKEILGGHMVESKTGKRLEVFIKGANGEANRVYYLGQFD
ncbi:MAG: hypothetical protein QM445_06530, partial [Thermotogota bacterium]|nr:hypothetical protein [Thermotogota bacterium]